MNPLYVPDNTVFWYLAKKDIISLRHAIETDVVVIGGGMAGLTAAQEFAEKGARVILLEKHFCGSGATGKSSGFITPNSELSLHDLCALYGLDEAARLWNFVVSGVDHIRKNILDFNFACDYQQNDTLVVANHHAAFTKIIVSEYGTREKLGYTSTLYKTHTQLQSVLRSSHSVGGIAYTNSFGIHAYQYCIALKQMLQQKGVQIYEDTPVLKIEDHTVTTPYAHIKAQHIVVCVDQFLPDLGTMKHNVYHVQTCLMLSAPLTDADIAYIFPTKRYLVWDTDLIYNYFRLTGDNRLMLGGADVFTTYASQENYHNIRVFKKLQNYWRKKFPKTNITFEYAWPGLIGISKDLMPIAGFDKKMPSVYYVAAATGLPWAAALGRYSARAIIENDHTFDMYFSPYRSFKIDGIMQTMLGTKLTFALSNFMRTRSF